MGSSRSMECFNNELNGVCGGCTYMNPRNYTSGLFSGYTYKCTKQGGYYRYDSKACSKVMYVDPEKVDCCERYKDFTGRKYFILSAISEILELDENNRLISTIKSLIDKVRSDETTFKEACFYDQFGPDIADCLRNDINKKEICQRLLHNDLVNIYCLISLGNEDEAIELYKNMVMNLYFKYRNQNNYNELINPFIFENKKVLVK